MDGSARAAGAGTHISYEGELYYLAPMTVDRFAEVEQYLLSQRKSPIDAVIPELRKLEAAKLTGAKRYVKHLLDKAYADLRKGESEASIPFEDVVAWLDTSEGLIFRFTICLRVRHPDMTRAKVVAIIEHLGEEEAKRQHDVASAMDARGNSTGGSGVAADPARPTTDATSTPGEPSTDGLPTPTGGGRPSSAE